MESKTALHLRLPKDLLRRIDYLSVDWDTFRSQTAERLIRKGLEVMDVEEEQRKANSEGVRPGDPIIRCPYCGDALGREALTRLGMEP